MKIPRTIVHRLVKDYAGAELGDARLTRRACKILGKLARQPGVSLPAAMGTEAEYEGICRFVNNTSLNFAAVLAPEVEATSDRAKQAGSVLVVHDTTEPSFPALDPKEIGYLPTGKAGFLAHISLVLDARGWRRPLGVIYAETIHRATRTKRNKDQRRATGNDTAGRPDREFLRWVRGVEASADALEECERVTHIADREGDSYELIATIMALQQGFVIRHRVNRRAQAADGDDSTWSTVKEVVSRCDGMMEREVPLSRRRAKGAPGMNRHAPRKMRLARLSFSATRVLIPRPQYMHEPWPEAMEVNVVHVVEKDPPPEQEPVEWLLYTSDPIDRPAQVAKVVDMYRSRWTIEELNAALKTGCAYEAREFESRHALLNMLALSLPIACIVLALRSRARSDPTAPATDVLTPLQIRVLRHFASRPVPPRPTAEQVLFAVAGLGGHQKGNGPPGWKVLQRGMTLLCAYEAGWLAREAGARRGRKM